MKKHSEMIAACFLILSLPSRASALPTGAAPEESAPTSEQVIAYLRKDGPPHPELRFRSLPAADREGLRFGAFENIDCTEKVHYREKAYWRCFYDVTAFTRSGTKLTARGWVILGHDGKGGLQPIMLETVPKG